MPEALVPFEKPFLWEILLHIFEQCDPSTLAALGAVSMDILESTSPLLYGDIVITSSDQLGKLFCQRSLANTTSRVNQYLDLSPLKKLSLVLTPIADPPNDLVLPSSRLSRSNPLPIARLILSCREADAYILSLLHNSLLRHLNPIHLEYDVREASRPISTLGTWRTLDHFSRLQEVAFKGNILYGTYGRFHSHLIASLPSPTLDRRRVVRLHLASLFHEHYLDASSLLRAMDANRGF